MAFGHSPQRKTPDHRTWVRIQLPPCTLAVGMWERVRQVRARKHFLGTLKRGPQGRQAASPGVTGGPAAHCAGWISRSRPATSGPLSLPLCVVWGLS